MSIMDWYNKKLKKLNVWDIAEIKTYSFLIGLIVGAYAAGFVRNYIWIITIVTVLLIITLVYNVLKK